jgi:beta-galactosidase
MKSIILPAVLIGLLSSGLTLAADDVVLMAYFRDNGNAGTFLCVSEDGLKFRPLNNGRPIFTPGTWPGQGLTRDPSILYHDGNFRLVWTTNWTGRVFGYAESADLAKWSEPVLVSPFPEGSDPQDVPKSVWAPEIHWDPLQKNYLILWSSNTPRLGGFRTFATRTTDGKTFTPAKLFFDPGIAVIDAQMLLDPSRPNGLQWLMVVKDERAIKEGGKALHLTAAPLDFNKPWAPLSPSVIGPGSTVRPEEMVEGGCLVKFGGEYRLYCDAFANGHYSLAESPDLKTWTDLTPQLDLPKGVRHGTVFTAPRAAVGWLNAADVSGGQAARNSTDDREVPSIKTK